MIWMGSDEALASNSSVTALLQNSACDIFMMHDLWSNRPRGRTQQRPQAQFKLSHSMLHLTSEEVQGAGGRGSNTKRIVSIHLVFSVANPCIPKTILVWFSLVFTMYMISFSQVFGPLDSLWTGSLVRSAKDQKGSVPLAPQILELMGATSEVSSFWGPRVPLWSRHLSGKAGLTMAVQLLVKIVRSN